METNTPVRRQRENRTVVIPLWEATIPRALGKERRKDGGTLDRHVQAATGVAPVECIQRRNPPPPQLERAVRLWLETDDAEHELLPATVVRAA